MKLISKITVFWFFIFIFNSNSFAVLSINIDNGKIEPINVAIVGLENNHKLSSIIMRDLNDCGFFKANNLALENLSISSKPNFDLWIKNNINFLITAVATEDERTIAVQYRVWNTFTKKHVFGKSIKAERGRIRQLAHMVADDIYEAGTGSKGYFNTRILYVAESGPLNNRSKRLAIIDYDGENHHYITGRDQSMILSPRISPDNTKIMYMSFATRIPKINIYDRLTNERRIMGNFDGMTSAPRFGFGTNIALLALSKNGNTNIYKFDINTSAYKKLTDNNYINTSPSYSPDNRFIVFNSDRSGSPQLYMMRNDGSDQKRISFGQGKYFNPVWSPSGDHIAFIKILQGVFYIGIMRPDGSNEKILASGYMIESPSWAPNGKLLIFTTTNKGTSQSQRKSRLYMVDITNRYHKLIKLHEDATDPMWSERINFDQ